MDRRTSSGRPIGAAQAITLDETLRAHTISAARALRMEDRIGSLEAGKLADIVIVDADLTRTALADPSSTDVWATILDGQVWHPLEPTALEL
jgi:hypothetical protein